MSDLVGMHGHERPVSEPLTHVHDGEWCALCVAHGEEQAATEARRELLAKVEELTMPSWRDRPSYEHGWEVAIYRVLRLIEEQP